MKKRKQKNDAGEPLVIRNHMPTVEKKKAGGGCLEGKKEWYLSSTP